MRGVCFRIVIFAIVVGGVFVANAALAEVANRYGGRVILFDKRPPTRWASDSVFHRFVKQHRVSSVNEGDDGNWRFEYMAFFRRPVGDREVTIRFYDAEVDNSRILASYTLYLRDPRDRIVGGTARLDRPDFSPNHQYKITVTSRGKTLARLNQFTLVGQEPERSGEVNFSVEDTRGR